jgi:hypothetical protein
MTEKETTVRIKPEVWNMIQFEQRLGESKSDTIERVFNDRFNVYEQMMKEMELKEEDMV